ncbi:MAG: hypothetical protein Q8N34_11980 [Gammaproteobacteria bacterium]|nr:hypothetical protein [Gammaproteobacteria bacterium]
MQYSYYFNVGVQNLVVDNMACDYKAARSLVAPLIDAVITNRL